MKITILGNNSASPAYGRFPTSQIVTINQHHLLVDCGEGAQMKMNLYKLNHSKISNIFISHSHGDHYFGLVGLLSSMSLLGRKNKLNIFCTPFIKSVIDLQLPWELGFELNYFFLKENESEILIDNDKMQVKSFPVFHSVPTHGFLFTEKNRIRILLPEKVKKYNIPKYYYSKLTSGEDFIDNDGSIIKNTEVTTIGNPSKMYAYCADTVFDISICNYFLNADLIYHETTYLHQDIEKATNRMHTTTLQAATIAKNANCKQLIIGHFSSKYKNLELFKEECKTLFENTEIAHEGMTFEI